MTNAKKKKSLLYVALSLALSVVLLVGVLVIHTAAENAEGSDDPYVTGTYSGTTVMVTVSPIPQGSPAPLR